MSAAIQALELSEKKDIIALCGDLAEKFIKRAPKYDKEGSFPVENFQDLKDAGLLGIMIPKEHGGMGADFLTYTKALEQLAMGCSSTALTFNMHNIAVGSIAELNLKGIGGSRGKTMTEFRDWVYDQSISHKKVFASASSEPGIGAHFSKLKTTYKRVEDGFVINGTKSFVSMAGYADYYVVAAKAADSDSEVPAISYLVVEKDHPNTTIDFIWDVLGMRATSTNPVHFKDCFVKKEALFLGSEGMALYKIAREPHWLVGGYVGVYLGISTAAFRFMVDFIKKKKIPGTDTSLSEDPKIQHRVGEIYAALESARTVTYNAAMLVRDKLGSQEANNAIHHAKYVAGELGPWLTSQAIRLCGASSLAKVFPLERYYRDSRCGGLMPATSDECLSYMGKAAFGTDLTKPTETYW
ncbi:acyl-CoA dehydrogenase family protein [Fulvivirgaceae bacterium BMA10]|uniref:Acyl-CoA dehydrogenase family protein n=1 Tax=Splendidivirga corallicola TaxID=3051826 RepID=A0ABT8KX95_9BACT|nr:acyl-CoA dehydrogenase family protein [Fulvivirgaceae bacterium BMA10]